MQMDDFTDRLEEYGLKNMYKSLGTQNIYHCCYSNNNICVLYTVDTDILGVLFAELGAVPFEVTFNEIFDAIMIKYDLCEG